MQIYLSTLSFSCPECRAISTETVEVPAPSWDGDTADERATTEQFDVTCPTCDKHLPILVDSFDGTVKAKFCFETSSKITCTTAELSDVTDDPDAFNYLELPFDAPSEELGMHLDSCIDEIRRLMLLEGHQTKPTLKNRMAFLQLCASMEAFLQDVILSRATSEQAVINRLIENDKDLKGLRFSMQDIAKDPDLIKKTVIAHLREILFHNLGKVEVLFRMALQVELFKDPELRQRMHRAMRFRHDCAHRNGRDRDGAQQPITSGFVLQFASDLMVTQRRVDPRTFLDWA